MAEICHLEDRHDVIFYAEGGAIWIKFRRLSTAVMWSKSKPDVEFQYGRRLSEFHGMSSQSHLPHCRVLPPGEFDVMIPELCGKLQGVATGRIQRHVIPEPRITLQCRVLPLGEFTVIIPEPHATLQGVVTWRNQCHDRATLQGVIIPSAILKIVFAILFLVFNAVWALTSGGFAIVSDTLVSFTLCMLPLMVVNKVYVCVSCERRPFWWMRVELSYQRSSCSCHHQPTLLRLLMLVVVTLWQWLHQLSVPPLCRLTALPQHRTLSQQLSNSFTNSKYNVRSQLQRSDIIYTYKQLFLLPYCYMRLRVNY